MIFIICHFFEVWRIVVNDYIMIISLIIWTSFKEYAKMGYFYL